MLFQGEYWYVRDKQSAKINLSPKHSCYKKGFAKQQQVTSKFLAYELGHGSVPVVPSLWMVIHVLTVGLA